MMGEARVVIMMESSRRRVAEECRWFPEFDARPVFLLSSYVEAWEVK